MPTIEDYRSYGKEIDDLLRLDSFTVAVKMIQEEQEIPAEAVRPKRDRNQHIKGIAINISLSVRLSP